MWNPWISTVFQNKRSSNEQKLDENITNVGQNPPKSCQNSFEHVQKNLKPDQNHQKDHRFKDCKIIKIH